MARAWCTADRGLGDLSSLLALHAAWETGRPGALVVWGETSSDAALGETGAPRPHGREPGAVADPFAASTDVLERALASCPGPGVRGSAVVQLPSLHRDPRPSPELQRLVGPPPREEVGNEAALELSSYTVPTLRFPPNEAFDLLSTLPQVRDARVAVGASLRALAELASLAFDVVARGRVVPALVKVATGELVARWEPIPQGVEVARAALAGRSLPRASWCLERSPGSRETALAVFSDLVDALCRDALCRDALSRDALCREAPEPVGGVLAEAMREGQAATPAAAWVGALGCSDAQVFGDPDGLGALERAVAAWRAPLVSAPSSWRLCFRLHEPGSEKEVGDAGAFRLELLLQAVEDPSLVVAAKEVWQAGASIQRAARTLDAPAEVLLSELGRAAVIFPELDTALGEPAPSALDLEAEGAYRFLAEVAPALEVAGFGVLVPSWWRHPTRRLGARLSASQAAPSGSGSTSLDARGVVSFEWEAAIGDEVLSVTELQGLAALKAPLVKVRGQWIELRGSEVDQLLSMVEPQSTLGPGSPLGAGVQSEARSQTREMRVIDVVRLSAGVRDGSAGVPVIGVVAKGALDGLLGDGRARKVELPPTPAGFCGTLRPYQRRALGWIEMLERVGLGACLADDMGLGKTATVLGVLAAERPETAGAGPTLVVCPTSVVGNWRSEIERFVPELSVVVHHGPERARATSGDALRKADVVVTSYPLVVRDEALLSAMEWRRVVLDEAQQIKNPYAAQSRSVRALRAQRRIALTGTPVENRLEELRSIMEFLNPGLLGTPSWFRAEIAVPLERYGDERAKERLDALVRPFLLRRMKTDAAVAGDLPEKLEMKVRCTLTREQATLYQAVVDEMLAKVDAAEGMERRGRVLSTILRLKQVCDHPALYTGDRSDLAGRSGKLERTVEVLEAVLGAHEKALVFTQFAEMGALLSAHLSTRLGCRVAFLHGGVDRARRDQMVAELQSPAGDLQLMVLSLKAGGTGLNLTAANQVIHFDRWWNPAVEDQATDRTHRMGQRRDVVVRKLVCAGTIEDRVDELIEAKRRLSKQAVPSGDAWLTELSTADLAAALALSVRVEELS